MIEIKFGQWVVVKGTLGDILAAVIADEAEPCVPIKMGFRDEPEWVPVRTLRLATEAEIEARHENPELRFEVRRKAIATG